MGTTTSSTTSTTTVTTSKLVKKAANLAANKASMTSAKAKISTLSKATGRLVGSAATSCAQIITISKKISTLSKSTPESSDITTNAKKISASTVTSCTAKEKTSLLTEVVSIGEALASVDTALTAVQAQIKTLTGSTAS